MHSCWRNRQRRCLTCLYLLFFKACSCYNILIIVQEESFIMNNKKSNGIFYLFPILSGVMWGMAGFFVRTMTDWGMDTFTLLESRLWIAVIVLAVGIFLWDKSKFKIKLKDIWLFGAVSLIGSLGLNVFYNISINSLTLSFSAVLLGLSPVFVVLMAAPLFGERITVRKGVCTVAAVVGCAMVSGIFNSGNTLHWTVPGVIIGVLSGFFYALYSVFSRMAMDRGYHALTVTFYSFLILTIVLVPFTKWHIIGDMFAAAPLENGLLMLAHSACVTILPYIFYNLALNHIEAGMASVLGSAEPVAAMIFGVIIYREIPSVISIIGLVIVLVALGVLSLGKDPDAPNALKSHPETQKTS